MLDFVLNNWRFILYIIFAIILIIVNIINLIKKGRISVTNWSSLLEMLPSLIRTAEDSIEGGKEKFAFVFAGAVKYLSELTGKSESFISSAFGRAISSAIENILDTPEKKGD